MKEYAFFVPPSCTVCDVRKNSELGKQFAISCGGGRSSEPKILFVWIQDRIFFSFKLATGEPVDMFILHIMS